METLFLSLVSYKLFIICFSMSDKINLLKTGPTLRCFTVKSSSKTFSQHVENTRQAPQVPSHCSHYLQQCHPSSFTGIEEAFLLHKSLNSFRTFCMSRDIFRVFSINNNENWDGSILGISDSLSYHVVGPDRCFSLKNF